MTEELQEQDRMIVEAVHEALRRRFGITVSEGHHSSAAQRCEKERENWKLAFLGATSEAATRHALYSLFAKAGYLRYAQAHWHEIHAMVCRDWERVRDLALLALASYRGRQNSESEEQKEEEVVA